MNAVALQLRVVQHSVKLRPHLKGMQQLIKCGSLNHLSGKIDVWRTMRGNVQSLRSFRMSHGLPGMVDASSSAFLFGLVLKTPLFRAQTRWSEGARAGDGFEEDFDRFSLMRISFAFSAPCVDM